MLHNINTILAIRYLLSSRAYCTLSTLHTLRYCKQTIKTFTLTIKLLQGSGILVLESINQHNEQNNCEIQNILRILGVIEKDFLLEFL